MLRVAKQRFTRDSLNGSSWANRNCGLRKALRQIRLYSEASGNNAPDFFAGLGMHRQRLVVHALLDLVPPGFLCRLARDGLVNISRHDGEMIISLWLRRNCAMNRSMLFRTPRCSAKA